MKNDTEFTISLPAHRVLENEDHYLQPLMNEWHTLVLAFANDIYTLEETHEAIDTLHQMLKDEIEQFKNLEDIEKKYVCKKLALYVGGNQGPIQATEEEHLEIDAYIGHFLHHTRGDVSEFSLEDMKALVRDAGEAYEVMTFHFVKEES